MCIRDRFYDKSYDNGSSVDDVDVYSCYLCTVLLSLSCKEDCFYVQSGEIVCYCDKVLTM